MSGNSKCLEVRMLSVTYGTKQVVKELDIRVDAGRICGLVGPNGAGKTTLLDALYGLVPVEDGKVNWDGSPLSRSDIGYLEAENYFYPMITGREYLELFRLQNPGFDIESWSQVFDLPLDQLIDAYSEGMKKKLALLGVLCLDRPVLVLDEPFNHLDLESSHLLKSVLQSLAASGRTILLTSHILASLTEICDDILFLLDGTLEASFSRGDFGRISSWLESAKHREKEAIVGRLLSG